MALREIRLYGDPVLTESCREVTDFAKAKPLIDDLIETTQLPGRAGVAANQIGFGLRAFSWHVAGETGYLINPSIVEYIGEPVAVDEGCLSLPGLWFPTPRFPEVVARGFDLDGNEVTVRGTGLLAQALQHECDHLDGKVYLDRLGVEKRREAMKQLRESEWFA